MVLKWLKINVFDCLVWI